MEYLEKLLREAFNAGIDFDADKSSVDFEDWIKYKMQESDLEYLSLIIDGLHGKGLKEKWIGIRKLMYENSPERELVLNNVLLDLKKQGTSLYQSCGSESYVTRCAMFDISEQIYRLSNNFKIHNISFGEYLSGKRPNQK